MYDYRTLGDLLGAKGYIRGPFGSALVRKELHETGVYAVYEQAQAISGSRSFRYFINQEKFEELRRFRVQPGDLLISCSGTVGRVSIVADDDPDGIISQALLILRPQTGEIIPEYLRWFLSTREGQNVLTNASHGSVQVNIAPRATVESIEIPTPDLRTQKAIAHILGTLDDKIELNQKMNQTLEEITKAIFKSWFVDFDPVRAKAEGRPTGLLPEISDLFPDELVDSEIGEIPKGWSLCPLGEFIDVQGGLSYKAKFLGDGVPIVTMGCINPQGRFKRSGLKHYGGEFRDQHKLTKGSIVISTRDVTQDRVTLGAPALVPSDIVGAILATNMYKVLLKRDIGNFFLFETMRTSRYRENIIASAKGSTVLMLTKDAVLDYKFSLPQPDLLNYFQSLSALINERIDVLHAEISVLQQIRDALLPKLISGELRIPDAEKFLEEAGI